MTAYCPWLTWSIFLHVVWKCCLLQNSCAGSAMPPESCPCGSGAALHTPPSWHWDCARSVCNTGIPCRGMEMLYARVALICSLLCVPTSALIHFQNDLLRFSEPKHGTQLIKIFSRWFKMSTAHFQNWLMQMGVFILLPSNEPQIKKWCSKVYLFLQMHLWKVFSFQGYWPCEKQKFSELLKFNICQQTQA